MQVAIKFIEMPDKYHGLRVQVAIKFMELPDKHHDHGGIYYVAGYYGSNVVH